LRARYLGNGGDIRQAKELILKMMNIYLDIDGTLHHKKGGKPANHLKEFLEYIDGNEISGNNISGNEISKEKLSHDALIKKAKELCEKFEIKLVSIAQPLRLAITGSTCSPGIFGLIPFFTKEEINKRVTFLIKQL